MRGSIFVLPRKVLNMFVSDWHYRWFCANIQFNRLGSYSILSVVAARRTGPMLHRSGIYGRLH